MYYDSHTHLNDDKLFFEYTRYIDLFIQGGGKGVVNIGGENQVNEKALEIGRNKYDIIVKSAIGYDPYIVNNGIEKVDLNELSIKIEKNKSQIVAIGEIGIDYFQKGFIEKQKEQKTIFAKQCELALEKKLPIVIHSREGFEDTIDVLKNYKNLKKYFHCWGYGKQEIKILLNTFDNFFVGFAGNITYPKAHNIRESLLSLPTNKILLETDAPYLAPQIKRGNINQPIFVEYIYDYVGNLLKIDKIALQNIIKINFENFYLV